MTVRDMGRADWEAVSAIDEEGIATFETSAPSWEQWDAGHLPWHVGVRERIGRLHGRWRDTLFLERRSSRI
jgi:phosphinothricin acetyltransferase